MSYEDSMRILKKLQIAEQIHIMKNRQRRN